MTYKKKIGVLAGCFDIIHPGYIYMFEEAKYNCDKLIVLLQTDPTIDRPEKNKPILSLNERIKILESIKYIDEIVIYGTEKELYELLKKIKPDVRFLGDDYIGKEINGGDLNIKIIYINRKHGWSSTKFKQLIFDELYNEIWKE
jgi:glycerol-3-phosphate cytidylyltransferase